MTAYEILRDYIFLTEALKTRGVKALDVQQRIGLLALSRSAQGHKMLVGRLFDSFVLQEAS